MRILTSLQLNQLEDPVTSAPLSDNTHFMGPSAPSSGPKSLARSHKRSRTDAEIQSLPSDGEDGEADTEKKTTDHSPVLKDFDTWLKFHTTDGGREVMETICAFVRIRRMSAISIGPPDLQTLKDFAQKAKSRYSKKNPSLPPPFDIKVDGELRKAMGNIHRRKVSSDKVNLAKIASPLPSKPSRPCYHLISGHLSAADKVHNTLLSTFLVGRGTPFAHTILDVRFFI
jgi:hypothetical protein